jgi:protein-S-isoprenylcysteine O-methyltransferase Ste14
MQMNLHNPDSLPKYLVQTIKARVLVVLQFTFLGLLFIRPGQPQYEIGSYIKPLTLGLTFLASLILAWAIFNLRPALRVSPIPKPGSPLVSTGIYKWISHPMYFAVMLFGLSMFISHINYLSAAVLISLFLVLRTKAGLEEQLLEKIHGKYRPSGFLPMRGI